MAEKPINRNEIPDSFIQDPWQAQMMAEKEDIQRDVIRASREMVDISKKKWGRRSRDQADVLEQSHQELVDQLDLELEEYGENMGDIIGFLETLRAQAEYADNPDEHRRQHEMELEIEAGIKFFKLNDPNTKAPHVPAIGLFMRQPNISRAIRLSDSIFDAHRTTE